MLDLSTVDGIPSDLHCSNSIVVLDNLRILIAGNKLGVGWHHVVSPDPTILTAIRKVIVQILSSFVTLSLGFLHLLLHFLNFDDPLKTSVELDVKEKPFAYLTRKPLAPFVRAR